MECFGVFSSLEKAREGIIKEAKNRYIGNINYWRISEWEMDNPDVGNEIEIIKKEDILEKVRLVK